MLRNPAYFGAMPSPLWVNSVGSRALGLESISSLSVLSKLFTLRPEYQVAGTCRHLCLFEAPANPAVEPETLNVRMLKLLFSSRHLVLRKCSVSLGSRILALHFCVGKHLARGNTPAPAATLQANVITHAAMSHSARWLSFQPHVSNYDPAPRRRCQAPQC